LLSEGVWNGNDLLQDEQYFYDMTHQSQPLNEGYGYLTWLNNTQNFMLPESQFVFPNNYAPNAPMEMFAAIGRDGQFISVVPSQNLVWIRMGENPEDLNVPILMIDDIWEYINALPCEPSGVDLNVNTTVHVRPNPTTTQWLISMQEPIRKWVLFDTRGIEVASDDSKGASAFSVNAEEL
ncbi:MAG: hypothetical protein ACKO7B_00760, partial [Flavobacteriales bacterium]